MLIMICCVIYATVAMLGMRSAFLVRKVRGPGKSLAFWITAAAFFAILIVQRLVGFEEHARSALRKSLVIHGDYAERREFQAPLAVAVLLLLIAAGFMIWRLQPVGSGRSPEVMERWALYGLLGMIGLIALRMVSFHATDVLLYGALHLNWVIDIGTTSIVGWAAWRHARLLRSAPGGARHRSRRG